MNIQDLPTPPDDSEVAIIGMVGRFPGARNLEEFWCNLRNGIESISHFSEQEAIKRGATPELLANPNYVTAEAILDDIDLFDGAFFGYSPGEADTIDPQHRIFLEYASAALEDAGYDPDTCDGAIGIYAGQSKPSYLFHNLAANSEVVKAVGPAQLWMGNGIDFLTTRVSYKLNLKGPSCVIQTGCSTSLVAVHMATQSILSGECYMALAGGVAINSQQGKGYFYQEGGLASQDGHCRTFDVRASGAVGGNGIGIVVLKRLADALNDEDHIYAVIKGSSANNDGSLRIGFTAPSVEGQAHVIAEAMAMAGCGSDEITYVEAHGTATPIGDPIEVAALTKAFGTKTTNKRFCGLGSVKTNIGHLDAASGVTGLIKTVLALQHRELPPSLSFETPNPSIDFENSPFYVNTTLKKWESRGKPLRAGVSSFGVGGTNAHVVIEEPPQRHPSGKSRPWQLLSLSAKSEAALEVAASNLALHLKEHPELSLADVAYTCHVGRKKFTHRLAIVSRDLEDAIEDLETLSRRSMSFAGIAQREVVFMFTSQGAEYPDMAHELYQSEPEYRKHVTVCSKLLEPHLGFSLNEVVFSNNKTQAPAYLVLFVLEYALARTLMSWGIKPQTMIGHGLGEYVAACLAGVFSLSDALALIAVRGQLLESLPPVAMLNVSLSLDQTRSMLGSGLSLAAVNGPSLCVISGSPQAVDELERTIREKGENCHRSFTSHGTHPEMVEPIMAALRAEFEKVKLAAPTIPYISNVTGTWITDAQATNVDYWTNQLRTTVQFSAGMQELFKDQNRIMLEIGPGQTLCRFARLQLSQAESRIILSSLRRAEEPQQSDVAFLLKTIGKLWVAGADVDWQGFYSSEKRHRLSLPTYPFERRRHWIDAPNQNGSSTGDKNSKKLKVLRKNSDLADWFYVPYWKPSILSLNPNSLASELRKSRWLIFIGDSEECLRLTERLRRYGCEIIEVRASERFEKLSDNHYTINTRDGAGYDALIDQLRLAGKLPDKIVHLWSLTRNSCRLFVPEEFRNSQGRGFYSLLFLAKALSICEHPIEIITVTNNMQAVDQREIVCPEKATTLGICKVIPQEFSNITCRSVDVVLADGPIADERLLDSLVAELAAHAAEQMICYRGSRRLSQAFEPVRLPPVTPAANLLREGGVYLITGGLGGIGLSIADYLAQTVTARLVLTGRSAFPAEDEWEQWLSTHDESDSVSRKIQTLRKIKQMGSEVLVIKADVSNYSEMAAAQAQALQLYGRIDGVIHTAGVTGGGMIQLKTIEEAERVLAPKVSGTLVLASLFNDVNLDFFVMCSSLAALLGGFGQADYSAANAFLDAFAHFHSACHAYPTVSINWDTWQEVGMALTIQLPADLQRLQQQNVQQAILTSEGVEVFSRILGTTLPQVVISTRDLPTMIERQTSRKGGTAAAMLAGQQGRSSARVHPRPPLSVTYVAPANEFENSIAGIWQEVLGIQDVGVHDSFYELGGHSLLAMQLLSRLRERHSIDLPLRSFFENPTVSALASLVEHGTNGSPSSTMSPIKSVSNPTIDQLLSDLN